MKAASAFLLPATAMLFLGASSVLAQQAAVSMAALQATVKPVVAERSTGREPGGRQESISVPDPVVVAPTKVIVGSPTSSLSKKAAMEIALDQAARIPNGGVATWPDEYTGRLGAVLPANAIFVVEAADFEQLHAFDLVLFVKPNGRISARQLLAKVGDKAVLGNESDGQQGFEVDSKSCVGRIVVTIRFDPAL